MENKKHKELTKQELERIATLKLEAEILKSKETEALTNVCDAIQKNLPFEILKGKYIEIAVERSMLKIELNELLEELLK